MFTAKFMDRMSVININMAYTNCIAEQWTATTVHSLKYYNYRVGGD